MTKSYLENLFSLEGKVVAVLGGTGVLGGALCDGIAKAGANVIVAGRNEEAGKKRVEAIKQAGGEATFLPVDVMERQSIEALLAASNETYGEVYGLVNCVGMNSAVPYFEIEDENWDAIMAANLRATHQACQLFGNQMVEAGRGAILNIGSVTSGLPLSKVYAYSCSKAAVLSLTRNLGRELAPQGVRVNCLCPGFFPAEQNRKILNEERIEDIMRHTPANRFGEPEELLGATLLLLSPNAGSFINGASIFVDGGYTAMTI